jgi:hypothetical protein
MVEDGKEALAKSVADGKTVERAEASVQSLGLRHVSPM